MTISPAGVRRQLRAWLAGQSRDVEALQQALRIVYRGRPPEHSVEGVLQGLLLVVARRHEGRVGASMGRLEEILTRLLDDVHNLGGRGTSGARRAADLHALTTVLDELASFQSHVRSMVDKDPSELRATLRALLAGGDTGAPLPESAVAAAVAAADRIPPLARTLSRGRGILANGEQALEAWRQGYTLEPRSPVPVQWREHPALVERMDRMRAAMDSYRATTPSSPEAAVHAADELQRAVAEGVDGLRTHGYRFAEPPATDRVPPSKPVLPGTTPAPGTAASAALAVRARLANPALTTHPAAAELFDALHFSDLDVQVRGVAGEPVARGGLEDYTLTPDHIRALGTDPPWLAGRLADLLEGWQRSHLAGPGFGGESFAGIMLAPWGVNQLAQNKGVEKFVRAAAKVSHEVDVTIRGRGRRLAIPLEDRSFAHVDVFASLHYDIQVPGRPGPVTVEITVRPDGSWQASHNLPAGTAGADFPLQGTR